MIIVGILSSQERMLLCWPYIFLISSQYIYLIKRLEHLNNFKLLNFALIYEAKIFETF
jgi:hypothetical protein